MLSFKSFISEATEIFDDDKGKHYITDVGPHKVGVHFYPNGNDRYEVGVDINHTDQTRIRNKMSKEHRQAAVLTAMSHIRHFIKNQKPYELIAKGNSQFKRKMYRNFVDILHSRTPGADKSHSASYSKITFPPTEDQAQRISAIKSSNLSKMREIAARRTASNPN